MKLNISVTKISDRLQNHSRIFESSIVYPMTNRRRTSSLMMWFIDHVIFLLFCKDVSDCQVQRYMRKRTHVVDVFTPALLFHLPWRHNELPVNRTELLVRVVHCIQAITIRFRTIGTNAGERRHVGVALENDVLFGILRRDNEHGGIANGGSDGLE